MADKKWWDDRDRTPACQDALSQWKEMLGSGDMVALIAQPVKPWPTKNIVGVDGISAGLLWQ